MVCKTEIGSNISKIAMYLNY